MKTRLRNRVFIRHAGEESVVWCPNTGGCTVMQNAQPILDEVKRDWRDVEEIVLAVAGKFGCGEDEVREGVEAVVGELSGQRFVDLEATGEADEDEHEVRSAANLSEGQDDDWTPLGDFYQRHGLPCELHLDLTDGCNERCVHCYLPKGGGHFLDTGIALKVLNEFREAQGLTVFVSGGECMLHRDFGVILRHAKELQLNTVVMSNLTLCDGGMVELLAEIEPQFVNVSLYAVTEAIHDGITQVPRSCRKTKAAIDALLAAGVPIRVATPFMRENKGCVKELKAFVRKRGIHLIPDAEIFGSIDHSCSNQNHALSLGELDVLVSGNRDVFAKRWASPEQCAPAAKVCDIGEARLNLDAEGRYYPCDGFHGAIIGDARKDSLWEVWTGEALNRLRALKNKDFGECASCEERAWCKVCPMRNFNETGDMFRHAPWRCGAARIYRRIFEEQ